ncbi:MAG: NADH-quinone oxidoreductase subunit H [Bdellovibrionaceae bacterium]|nr:NADH-quinone oxidoreductase subunit H [Pseudobdellovibrionaceae bacterium]
MGVDAFETTINVAKMFVIFLMMVQAVPVLVWLERRGSAFIQNRFGPNRVGPLGLMQLLADAVKFLFKEEFLPKKAVAFLYYAAPVIALVPGALALASIPLGPPIEVAAFEMLGRQMGPYVFKLQGYDIGIGIVFILGVSSLGAYGLLMAGWGSASKYSLLGALRASAQMISYELALSLSLVGILLVYGTFNFYEIIAQQQGPLRFMFWGKENVISWLPNWGVFFNPVGMILFAASTFAEANRLPFDLPEAEGELVAGFHTEYGGFKMLMFFIGEYGHMIVASALLATFYFGGYGIPFVSPANIETFFHAQGFGLTAASALTALVSHLALLVKVALFLWVFIWVRWTLPRFRYDQLMDLGWKSMLPWALANVVVTAVWLLVANTK